MDEARAAENRAADDRLAADAHRALDVRRATAADVEAIVALQRVIHADHIATDAARWSTAASPAEAYPAWLRELFDAASHGLVLVAERAGRTVGYLIAEVEPESARHWIPRAVYIHDLYVEPDERRGGAGQRLMESALRWASAEHPSLQVRLTTAADNEAARRFFARHGFRACAVELLRPAAAVAPASEAASDAQV